MVKRTGRPGAFYIYLAFAMLVLVASWEGDISHAMAVSQTIPQDSIRLRILANSDSPVDQWTKRQVKNVVVTHMNKWVAGPTTLVEAREIVSSHLPEIEKLIGEELQRLGFDYAYKAELAVVPFPTKYYGNRKYPSGDYEALRISLGAGGGQNWWCVLFPPLCFVDAVSGEKVAKAEPAVGKDKQVKNDSDKNDKDNNDKGQSNTANKDNSSVQMVSAQVKGDLPVAAGSASEVSEQPEVRFFLWDVIVSLFEIIRGWFS